MKDPLHLHKLFSLLFVAVLMPATTAASVQDRPPNIVIFFADDMGYADLSCFGSTVSTTPNLDRLAKDGAKLTSFYVASPACTPSRAALMTGCYPVRVSMPQVIGPGSKVVLNHDETTIAELLKSAGYATAAIGKWHLGDGENNLPTAHGFDEYLGLPYSNDMWPYHYGDHDRGLIGNPNWPDLPLIEGTEPIELNPRQESLTPRYNQRALDFITRSKDQPFFLYYAHSHPHVPIAASDQFKGKTGNGLYADMILEIDDSVGQVVAKLEELNLAENTLVIFTSDNGPWAMFGNHAGEAGPFRGSKGMCFEGGMRVPCVAYWPGTIPPGTESDQLTTAMDLLPTVAALAGAQLPGVTIDGHDIAPILLGKTDAKTPYDAFFYYYPGELHAVRVGDWKLHVPHNHRTVPEIGNDGNPGRQAQARIELSLYNLATDPAETTNLANQHPEKVAELLKHIEHARTELGDTLTNRKGKGVRPAGRR